MVDPTEARTTPEFVRALASSYRELPAVVTEHETLTYAELDRRSALRARGLLARGVGKGTRVGFLFGNGPEWVITWAAIARMGAVPVPLSTFLKPPELARVVRHADLQGVFAQSAFLAQDYLTAFTDAFPALAHASGPPLRMAAAPHLRWIALTGDTVPGWARSLEWIDEAAVECDDDMLRSAEAEVHPDDPGMMIYTSGQSAAPKGVVHSHGTVMNKVHYLRYMLEFGPGSQNTATMPFFWVGGLVMTLFTTMEAGGVVVCSDGATRMGGVFGSGGKGPTEEMKERQSVRLVIGLGMTETFGMYSWGNEPPDPSRSQWCPRLTDFEAGYDVKVVDEAGTRVLDGERGEIALRGPTLMLGLHKVDRSVVFDADGYYRTGDLVEVDGDGFHFVGRKGDMIKTSGANVSPAEVEAELMAIDGIASAFVVGVDDDRRGQVVGAAVVPEADVILDRDEVLATLRGRLSTYKVPRLLVFLGIDDVPQLPSLKVQKPELARMIRARAEDRG